MPLPYPASWAFLIILLMMQKLIGKQDRTFEDLITDLDQSRTIIEKEQEEILQYKAEIEKLKNLLIEKVRI